MNIKKISILLLVILTFVMCSLCFTIQVNAEDIITCPMCGREHDMDLYRTVPDGGFKKWVFNMERKAYGGEVLSDNAEEVMRFDIETGTFAGLWAQGETLYNLMAQIGSLLVVVYVAYNLLTKAAEDNMTPENIVQAFIRLLVAIIIARNGYMIIGAGMSIITAIFNVISPDSSAAVNADMCRFLKKETLFDAMLAASKVFIPWLIMLGASAIITITCWGRILDIMLRTCFAPIGMADLVNDGTKSSGFRYFKRLMASVLQGSIIMAMCRVYGMVIPVAQQMGGFAGWAIPIVLAFVLIGLTFKASGIANDVIG